MFIHRKNLMKRVFLFSALSGALLSLGSAQPASAQTNKAFTGVNPASNSDYGAENHYADLMMASRGWGVLNAPAGDNLEHTSVDANGWPLNDSSAYVFAGKDGQGMNGIYKLSFLGQATIGINGGTLANQVYNSGTNTTTADVTLSGMSAGTTYTLSINMSNTKKTSASGTNTGFTNMKLMRPGYAATTLFTTQAITLMQNFGALRFMDWLATNANQSVNWTDRNTPNTYSQCNTAAGYGWQGKGSSLEHAVALCNQTNCDMWVNIPHKASNDYITKVAQLILYGSNGTTPYTSTQASPVWAPLNAGLHVYVEFSNEIWNYGGAFSQTPDTVNAGIASYNAGDPEHLGYDGTTPTSNGFYIGMRYKAFLAENMSSIFRTVFGNAAMMTRVRPVFETQKGGISPTLQVPLAYMDDVWNNGKGNYTATPHPASYYFWGGGGSGYVEETTGTWDTSTTLTIDQLFNNYFPSAWPGWNGNVSHEAGILEAYGLKRDGYETGPGLDCANGDSCAVKQSGAFNDARISGVCSNMVAMWAQDGADMYMHFNASGNGTHGLLLNTFDSTSFKLQGMQSAASATRPAVTYGTAIPATVNAGGYECSSDLYSGPSTSTSPVNISSGSWFNYTVRVTASGAFNVGLTGSGGTIAVSVDGNASLGSLALPSGTTFNTGGLGVGLHSIRLTCTSGTATVTSINVTSGGGSPPPAPTGLTATAGNTQVVLNWAASSGATSYNVLRSTVSGSGYASVATGITPLTYTNTGLTNGTAYYFVVTATNVSGTSGNSNQASATPQAAVPPVPTGLTATAGNAQVALTWNASTDATAYDVKRSTVSGSGYVTVSSPTVTSYTNTGLTNGTVYYFVVDAKNASGASANSAQVSATPTAGTSGLIKINAGGPAAAPFVADVDFSGGTAYTNWTGTIDTSAVTNPAPQAVYQPERFGATTYTIGGLTPGTSYVVRLHFCENYFTASAQRVFNVSINGTPELSNFDIYATAGTIHKANCQQFTVAANGSGQEVIALTNVTNNALINGIEVNAVSAPPAPTGLTATAGNAQVTLSWNASSGATAYDVKRSTVSGSGYATVSSPTTTSYTNTGLTNGTTYYFVVDAKNAAGTSANSAQVSATPTAGTNFVQNPGFETGQLPNFWVGGGTIGVSTTTPHTGTYEGYEAGAFSSLFQNITGLTASHAYTVTVWAKLSATTTGSIDVYVTNFGGTKITKAVTSTSWTQFSIPFTTAAGNTGCQVGVEDINGSTSTCYTDDWSVN